MKSRFGADTFFIFIALLIASLTSHRAYVEMAGILLLWLCCMAAKDSREVFFSPAYLICTISAASVITACYLWFLMTAHWGVAPDLEKSAGNNYMFLLLVALFVVSLRALIAARIHQVVTALGMLLVLNSSILFLQTAVLIATKKYIDFVQPVTGEASRYFNYESVNPIFGFRPTGLYVEPSTFSAAVGAMAVGYILLSRARGSQPAKLPVLFAIVAMLITQSAAAVVQAGVLLTATILIQDRSMKFWWSVLLAMVIVASPGLIAAYLDSFLLKIGADSGIRLALMKYAYQTRHGWDFVFGYGPFGLESILYGLASGSGSPQVSSLNDAGLFNFFIVKYGIAGVLIPIWILSRMRRDVAGMLFFALLMSSKLSYMNPVLFLGLLPLVSRFPTPAPLAENVQITRRPKTASPMWT
ncbi:MULTISPECIES: hypothetical protein [unclassified Caballeronia]|uniref:hypothetical protein n=1 Tax=unclassified Caballeronia TaxID=2646786 RepID=UPI00285A4CE9|nr:MULTISPECIES: hypothetical protein [unclassified Caballeronia]MDR5752713.1 hypothetical protein [Caballeronia sp. LZ024]MDR5841355.1 hypothetical protein [Caballeronia sp. LZ031]